MEQLSEIKEWLLRNRNEIKANMETKAIEKEGFFDAQDFSGGNFDDCFNLGKEIGRAELIEELLLKC